VETGLPLRRHALHACQLELAHPIGDCWLTFQSPLPEDFEASICQLRESMTANPR
jgi:23S rRNA pseudouridine1911/1915/1917 synthase